MISRRKDRERADTYFIMGVGRGGEGQGGATRVSFFPLLLDKIIRLADD